MFSLLIISSFFSTTLLTIWSSISISTPVVLASNIRLDYHLYSQIQAEHRSSDGVFKDELSNQQVLNYFRLNRRSLEPYDSYLYFAESERLRLKSMAKEMFEFGYDNYMKHAFPLDELDPIHCAGRGPDRINLDNININDVLGDYLLTLVDSLSTLAVLGNSSEFKRASQLVIEQLNFDKNNTVQVFEATIRVLGGLISAHMIAVDKRGVFGDMSLQGYENEFLNLAHDLGVRLLAAFENRRDVKLPFPRVNLKYGVPENSFNHTCTSGAGTLMLEFAMLGAMLNDSIYEQVARNSVQAIFARRHNDTGLLGNELHIHTGEWLGIMSGLGAGLDSFYEYLLKSFIVFGDDYDYEMFEKAKMSVEAFLKHGRHECSSGMGHHPIYLNVNMANGKVLNNWIDSLQASYPSVQVLDGDLDNAICFHALYFAIWKKFGVLPERFNWNLKMPDVYFYPLRPEFAESTYFLYRATRNPFYLHVAKLIIENIYEFTKVKCGFATVHDVLDKSLEDRMESFFLSETLKYLYLTFDTENYLNNGGELEYIFTTEGHLYPIKTAYLLKNTLGNHREQQMLNSKRNGQNVYSYYLNTTDNNDDGYEYENDSAHDDDGSYFKPISAPKSKRCELEMSNRRYHNMRFNLPMKMRYFDQLFEMVGLNETVEYFLERKSNLNNQKLF